MEHEIIIPWSAVQHVLDGVTVATEAADGEAERIAHVLMARSSVNPTSRGSLGLSLRGWHARIMTIALEEGQRHFANLAVAVAFLRESSRNHVSVVAVDLNFTWSLVLGAIKSPLISWRMTRSSQGFLAVPLSSLIRDGNIEELFRLHVWEANGFRGDPKTCIHSHQTFVQSWILAGEGKDHTYEVKSADASTATHAEYSVLWSGTSAAGSNKSYKIQPTSSTIINTNTLVRVVEQGSQRHTHNMTYTVPANTFHSSEVVADTLHASLVLFDAYRGFNQEAQVLGPVNRVSFTTQRGAPGVSLMVLGDMVEYVREWETLMRQGMQHTMKAEFEEAIREYRQAMHVCESHPHFPAAPHYMCTVMARLGFIYRMLGRNELASRILEDARREIPRSELRAQIVGELAVVYRHMNRFYDAREACEDQYATAQYLGLDRESCRALGTLGMINYQLSLTQDPSLLETAVTQLTDRVESARRLKRLAAEQLSDPDARAEQIEWASQREAIGLGRLSMCFQRKGDIDRAISTALESVNVQSTTRDSGLLAFARGRYGLSLLAGGRTQLAIAQFNIPNVCSPIIYLCREPSDEHRHYIRDMIAAGADLDIRDELGYSALDCAIYSGDIQTQNLIEEGLRQKFQRESEGKLEAEEKLERHRYEAILRKGYRDIFQDKLRPVLLQSDKSSSLRQLRQVYAETLEQEKEKESIFDPLKYVPYADFLSCSRIPRSDDGYKQWIDLDRSSNDGDVFIIFLSYRWVAGDNGPNNVNITPDNIQRTQYKRMIRAIDQFRKLHPQTETKKLGIWIDFACIDQADYDHQKPGMAALMMNLTQCDAMISLIDETYYERSWCCVEVLMYQALRNAYGRHLWYEHVVDPAGRTELLRNGPYASKMKMDLSLSRKKVTYNSDRPILLFLERQTKLIS